MIRDTLLVLAMFLTIGCKARLGGGSDQVGQLADENVALRNHVAELQAQLDRRADELSALRQSQGSAASAMPGAHTPVLTQLKLGQYSGALDTNHDGVDDTVRLYVQTRDQQGRFLPVAGQAVLQVVVMPQGEGEPYGLARRTYDPSQWDEAYRSGFTGTHYTLEVGLPDPLPEDANAIAVRVDFTQADTGVKVGVQQPGRISR